MKTLALFPLVVILAGCSFQIPLIGGRGAPDPAPVLPSNAQVAGEEDPRPTLRPGDDPNAQASAAPSAAPGVLGTTLATLGDATIPGFWLETALASERGFGRVTAPDGTSVEVTLIPSGGLSGTGSQISLAAMRALGVSLTDIVQLQVEAL